MVIYESLFKCQAFFNFYILGIQGREREFKERTGRMPIGEVAEKKSRNIVRLLI